MDLSNLQRGWKKAKKHWEVGIELSINDNPKSPQIHTLPQFVSMPGKNYMDFTDLIHIIYWPAKIAQKEANTFK